MGGVPRRGVGVPAREGMRGAPTRPPTERARTRKRTRAQVLPTALRGAFQSCGQNCAGAERFIVHERVFDDFVG